MYKWIRNWLGYRDDYITLLEGVNEKLMHKFNVASDTKRGSLAKLVRENNKLAADSRTLEASFELAWAAVKGITEDRDELQLEHEQVMECCDRLVARNTEYASEIDKLKGDLMCSADRSERYRLRSIRLQGLLHKIKCTIINEETL